MTNVSSTDCAELRRTEANNVMNKITPMLDKLTDQLHNLETNFEVHATQLSNISKSLTDHMIKEEATQEKMWETIDKIHDKVTKNKTDNVSKIEFRWIVGLLVTIAASVLSYISYQITTHDEYDETQIHNIEQTMKKLHMK